MSTKKLGKFVWFWVLFFLLVSSTISFVRQFLLYRRLVRKLDQGEKELRVLQEENQRLTMIREAIERGELFVAPDKSWQMKKEEKKEEKLPNYKKWGRLLERIF